MAPLEDGSSGIEDDTQGARVSSGRLLIIPADASGNAATLNEEESGYSLATRALLYDAQGRAITAVQDGGQILLHVQSEDLTTVMRMMLKELRNIRMILQEMSDISFTEEEDE